VAGIPDPAKRKQKLDQWRAGQRAAARAGFPLSNEQMQAIFDMLDTTLPVRGCDHTLKLVQAWTEQVGAPFESVANWCRENGGCCDCEVLSNSEERWKDANRDVDWE
jgi:hypothetical protein